MKGMFFMGIEKTLEYIHKVKWLGSKPGLSRTTELLERLGNPHKKLKFVHVAGTNGKGSTCSFIANVLSKSGYKTGLYTSPYINVFNERIRIDGVNISDADLEKYTDIVRPCADAMSDPATEFEIITALAMKYFADCGCDIVVLEVGMGGELDSTNVIDTPECAVIASIGLDHTAQLGSTVAEVAAAKAGIIKGGDAVSFESSGDAYNVIKKVCEQKSAVLHVPDFSKIENLHSDITGSTFSYGEYRDLRIYLAGAYQPKNAVTALEALDVLRKKGYKITPQTVRDGFAVTKWVGRFEVLGTEPTFILDGAHNPHGMKAMADSLKMLFGEKKLVFVTGAMADKDIDGMYSIIVPMSDIFYTVTPDNARSMDKDILAEHIGRLGGRAMSCEGFDDAITLAVRRAGAGGVVVALGSLYFSADIRHAYETATGKNVPNA